MIFKFLNIRLLINKKQYFIITNYYIFILNESRIINPHFMFLNIIKIKNRHIKNINNYKNRKYLNCLVSNF